MKKSTRFILLLVMAVFAGKVSAQESTITFTTEKAVGSTVNLLISVEDTNIEFTGITGTLISGQFANYTLTSQTVTIKGNVIFFNCERNQITSLTLSNMSSLTLLGCQHNKLTTIDLSGAPNIRNLSASNNRLETIDLSHTQNVENVYCQMNRINGENMTNLVNSLPHGINGRLYAITTSNTAEQNALTANDIAIANSKGWGVYYRNSGADNGPYTNTELAYITKLSVYPKTTTDMITLQVPTNLIGTQVSIISTDGRMVHNATLTAEKTAISLSHITNGIYWVKVGKHTEKIIKR